MSSSLARLHQLCRTVAKSHTLTGALFSVACWLVRSLNACRRLPAPSIDAVCRPQIGHGGQASQIVARTCQADNGNHPTSWVLLVRVCAK